MNKLIFLSLILLFIQLESVAQTDSLILNYDDFIEGIYKNHPLASKAELQIDRASAERLAAKGLLDPEITSGWNQKRFDNKQYYRQYNAEIRVPTKLGIDVVGGYENSDGVFLNPENNTDNFGLWHLGVEANLIQGLFVNERKITLQLAEVFGDLAENEKQSILNDLIYSASIAYLQWQKFHFFEAVILDNIEFSKSYYSNTVTSYQFGEKTAIDTLEAFIAYQDMKQLYLKNQSSLIKSRQNISFFLWSDDRPIDLRNNTFPDRDINMVSSKNATNIITNFNVDSNPDIASSINKQNYYEIEQKLKREKLKPKLKLKYNPLLATSQNNIVPNVSISDFKWGFEFSFPLFLRSERASIQKGELKIREISLDIENKRNQLQNKIDNNIFQQITLEEQLQVLEKNVLGYKNLLDAEIEKFNYGESSVFLINKRQEKYIDGKLKLIELKIKIEVLILEYLYLTNSLSLNE